MENKAKYMAYVIGLAKIGVTVALINYHLKQEVKSQPSSVTFFCLQFIHAFNKLRLLNIKKNTDNVVLYKTCSLGP